jgi:hypothetical protein
MNNPDHISESLERIIRVKILKFWILDPGSEIRDGKILIRINIPDPQHCFKTNESSAAINRLQIETKR